MCKFDDAIDDVRIVFYENGTLKCATQQAMPVAANAGHKKRIGKRSFFLFKPPLGFDTANGLMVGKFHYLCRLVK